MSDNPFDDLAVDDDGGDEVDDAPAGSGEDGDADSSTETKEASSTNGSDAPTASAATDGSSANGGTTTAATSDSETTDPETASAGSTDGPAFPYEEVKQRPLYARVEAWNAFEDALELEVERVLREYDVRDATGRELHDAALRVAADHPEEIATRLLEERGVDVNR